jgi:transposase
MQTRTTSGDTTENAIEFIKVDNNSSSTKEAAATLGMKTPAVSHRASRYRKRGYPVKMMGLKPTKLDANKIAEAVTN